MGRASRRKKMRREAEASSRRARQPSPADAETRQALLQVVAGLQAMREQFRRRKDRYESACRAWCGDSQPVPATQREWPEDSLGGRFFATVHIEDAHSAPSLLTADVPDHKVIAANSAHWAVAADALVRAVALDGLRPDHLVVSTLLDVLGPVAEAELAYGREMEAWLDRHLAEPGEPEPQEPKPQEPKPQEPEPQEPEPQEPEPQEPAPEFPEDDGPVLLLGGALVDATWAVVGNDPVSEVHALLARVLDGAVLELDGRVVADALIGAFGREFRCEGPGDADVLDRIGREVSADPLENLVAAKAVPARDVLRAGLTILSALTELCSSDSVSVLRREATSP